MFVCLIEHVYLFDLDLTLCGTLYTSGLFACNLLEFLSCNGSGDIFWVA